MNLESSSSSVSNVLPRPELSTSIYSERAKREFHIVRNNLRRPQFGVCARCSQKFIPLGDIWGQVEDFLRRKFDEHRCVLDEGERIVVGITNLS